MKKLVVERQTRSGPHSLCDQNQAEDQNYFDEFIMESQELIIDTIKIWGKNLVLQKGSAANKRQLCFVYFCVS